MYNNIKNTFRSLLLAAALGACQKAEPVETWTDFVDVSFDASRVALANSGQGIFIAAKYNGYPIKWDLSQKKIKVVEGEGKFEFYDIRTGETVAEKTIDVKSGTADEYILFQPTLASPVSFIDPRALDNETAPPPGHIKLKVSNYAQDLIPFNKVDVKMYIMYYDQDFNEIRHEVGMIRDIGNSVDEGDYHILPDGVPDGISDYAYVFEFMDSETGAPLLNHGGTPYSNYGFMPVYLSPAPEKHIFSVYLNTIKAWGETPVFIRKGEDFYEIAVNILNYK
ncbi:hypothetical protein [Chitinophaga cymbidii]|uniref:Uncharacterized protein n=1 Tax=Chitinophaga cymbidii TaxID=1096750 RepID=A0A512RFU9_9BACT|nr:hypothetical protein [Chitinophaga cymbidii]GEP94571.1 hypothetical protein CCY01nite_08310 [Chitinophaga cymbidii]